MRELLVVISTQKKGKENSHDDAEEKFHYKKPAKEAAGPNCNRRLKVSKKKTKKQ